MKQMFRKLRIALWQPRTLRIAAYAIPLSVLIVVLYLNYLPFGYDRTFNIAVGSETDETGQFSLSPYGSGLSERLVTASGTPYRVLAGSAYAIFTPSAYLRDATATITVDAPGVIIIPPNIDFRPDTTSWDYTLPQEAGVGGCLAFDGLTQKELPETSTLFTEPDEEFSVYAAWTPESNKDGFQQIVGYHSWELLQNKSDVKFQIGSTSIKYVFDDKEFYGKPHTALATYLPVNQERSYGYIELFVDNQFAGRIYFPASPNLRDELPHAMTLGKSNYEEASYFVGCVRDVRVSKKAVDAVSGTTTFTISRDRNTYPITLINLEQALPLSTLILHVFQK